MKKILYLAFITSVCVPAHADLSATGFPKTFQDLSFKSRVEVARQGYIPLMDKKAYQELNIVPGEEFYTDRIITQIEAENQQQAADRKDLPHNEYCAKYPDDTITCPETQISVPEQQPVTPNKQQQQQQQSTQQPPQTQQQPPHYTSYTGKTIGGGPVVKNNFVVRGSCYPAARVHSKLPNQILTTGKYENIDPAFEKGLISVFRKEGGCGKIKGDKCGYTCYGISECSGVRVKSRAEAEDVYYNQYWKPKKLDKLPDVIATDIFLASMGSGTGTAMQQFRVFLGLPKKTSPVDAEMIQAVNNYNGDIHNDWMDVREKFLMKVADRYKREHGTDIRNGYKNSIDLKRKNGCHVIPAEPIYR